MTPKRIAALTMVRNDDFFVRKWIDWYGAALGRENLYVYFDGDDQRVPDDCGDVHFVLVHRIAGSVRISDKGRADFLSDRASELFCRYDMVIGTDVDEFLVVDPARGESLAAFLSSQDADRYPSLSALGVDVMQNLQTESPLDRTQPILGQRSCAQLSSRYTKASVITRPLRWGSGFHRTRRYDFRIVPDLYLFHCGGADAAMLSRRKEDRDLSFRGWTRHFDKRLRLVSRMSSRPVRAWSRWVPLARRLQTLFRPPYCWNKPAMLGLRIVVRIPERFKKLL